MPGTRSKRRPMHDINIVPYVDVMLVLLVIFMVTAPLVTPGVIDLPTVDKAVSIAKQFGPDVINSVRVLQPQQVMLEVRFVEVTRKAGRELGLQWNVTGPKS